MGKFNFSENSWEEYLYWQVTDKKVLKRINTLLKDISRNGAMAGIGKPELLKGNLAGLYSRRIDEKNRLVYFVSDSGDIEILQCKGHYDDK
ncbi:Txe/YoeB family addiction module toxin [Megamonas sp.]